MDYSQFYAKNECVSTLPKEVFEYKQVGKSNYFYTDYRDSLCKELKRKKIAVPFIESNYIDGTCIKD